jgi:hypothetical protein
MYNLIVTILPIYFASCDLHRTKLSFLFMNTDSKLEGISWHTIGTITITIESKSKH